MGSEIRGDRGHSRRQKVTRELGPRGVTGQSTPGPLIRGGGFGNRGRHFILWGGGEGIPEHRDNLREGLERQPFQKPNTRSNRDGPVCQTWNRRCFGSGGEGAQPRTAMARQKELPPDKNSQARGKIRARLLARGFINDTAGTVSNWRLSFEETPWRNLVKGGGIGTTKTRGTQRYL